MTAPSLPEFILARVAEWEKWATEAKGDGDGVWASWNRSWDTEPQRDLAADGVRIAVLPTSIDEHVARHDPARVLRQCDAIRAIVADRAGDDGEWWEQGALVHLASIWSDHEDFQEEWAA